LKYPLLRNRKIEGVEGRKFLIPYRREELSKEH
jgi:hypothetical protein